MAEEKVFLVPEVAGDYAQIIECLRKIFVRSYTLEKYEVLKAKLQEKRYRHVYIVIPERAEKMRTQVYWQQWCRRRMLNTDISVLFPAEYYSLQAGEDSATIVVGWLKHAIMRKILYSFNTEEYMVLLYNYEKRWQRARTSKWDAALDNTQNRRVIEHAFSSEDLHISTTQFSVDRPATADISQEDELTEIETVLRENKYRRYVASGGQKEEADTVEAMPVNFVGGYLAFYRARHKIISASDIIVNDGEKIKLVFPNELNMGDFVVVRETARDLIREMADVILAQEGKPDAREMAQKWKEPLKIETLFYATEDIFRRLQNAGCTKGYQTVRSWLTDDEKICPDDKEDLKYIATVTESDVLNELLDQIYDAAQTVWRSHIKAGQVLSKQLRTRIADEIKKYGEIDPFNIWEPIEMTLDNIGLVRVLKIIDIGAPVTVDVSDTNRLLDEE